MSETLDTIHEDREERQTPKRETLWVTDEECIRRLGAPVRPSRWRWKMAMTEKGEAFVSRMRIVDQMVRGGTPMFAAMAAGLEDEDWTLVYVAARKMAVDIESQGESALTAR